MTTPDITMPKYITMKSDTRFNEKWLQDRLVENIDLLRLGKDVEVRAVEHTQPTGGRIDILLHDGNQNIRYEVEIQLGTVDESHIIRTIEYWDIERKRYPQYEHVAVIVAEEITSRFFNVISLFNGTIPLIAIQLNCVKVDGAYTLMATRVLDVVRRSTDEEDTAETLDRKYWEDQKSAPEVMKIVDELFRLICKKVPVEPRYAKAHIGITHDNQAKNFMSFFPNKKAVVAEIRINENDETTALLQDTDIFLNYAPSSKYKVQIRPGDIERNRDVLRELIRQSIDAHPKISPQSPLTA